jgi:hypothetical protein
MAQATKTRQRVGWSAVRRAKRWTQEQGEWVVSEWRRSGQSVQRFATHHALDPQRVSLWRKRAKGQPKRANKKTRPEVFEVKLTQSTLPLERRVDIELGNGRRLSVAERIELEVLERIGAALER